ncbi:phenylalanine--tRNA ligase subunit beta [Mangrovibacterium diazotrophicum]|uniref:Phenylalanine--tRNA ligase beta subunit n=1 Tax=Mangrovibacterium diazotrophicum TaxID=1261403 RepID=A0A419VW97_9BACT|nr:phenylalanine--tRNA ligase subunit beta [Mangrovibacterium diazotrophicum]RKD86346.1 phenylalanyl-tRNA synthetase beta subunit [Mangrovibacterium diazotrophicum]
MNISYKWLKDYIDIDLRPEDLESILTQTGLEVGSIEEVESIKGGLRGLVIGHVVTCEKHPNSDHLSKTTVDVGTGEILPIVCGAPNVAAGQKVVVATVGTTLYDGDNEFTIKKSKIRGEVSEGMICAEDEIGLGTGHDGIMVLPEEAVVGTPASEYFNVESDYSIEVDLTPNRVDGSSHIGVARDLAAFLSKEQEIAYKKPSVDGFQVDDNSLTIPIEVVNPEACPRYSGVTISGVEIKESPEWLQNRLKAIGLSPINNVVDITNYVLFECGQPLHAFDADEITGGKVLVKTMPAGTKFVTLDEVERELHEDDLMICNTEEAMCIGGVFGGIKSGVKDSTKNIFLESACFDPVFIRKTARRFGLSTDASFRFERGTDPNNVIFALKRAAMLIKEIAGGKISSEIIDIYPTPIEDFSVDVTFANIKRLIGKDLGAELIKRILASLEIKVVSETETGLSLAVPPYRVDVKREADVVEEILRIYGYNNVEIPTQVNASLQYSVKPDPVKIRNIAADMLTALGFNEIWSNSLTKAGYYENRESLSADSTVKLFNPLSADLNAMRQNLLFGGLEAVAYNANRKNQDLRLYEFGNCYFKTGSELIDNPLKNYKEEEHLALFVSGQKERESWALVQSPSTFFQLKSYVENLLLKFGLTTDRLKVDDFSNDLIAEGLIYSTYSGRKIVEFGVVARKLQKEFDIESPVYFADILMDNLILEQKNSKTTFAELPKYPEVRRDLALLIDKTVRFKEISDLANKMERKLLRSVDLFDVYEGKGVPEGKKSYAVSFILRDDEKTLNEKQIEKIMEKLIQAFDRELGATLR